MSDTQVRDRVRPQPGIRAILEAPGVEPKHSDPDGREEAGGLETFSLESTTYQAHARPGNKVLPSVHFILRDRSIRTCQYIHLESDSRFEPLPQGKGHRLTFRFAGSAELCVVIEGRNLWQLYDYITQHRMPWVYELPDGRDFEDARSVVIRSITFQAIQSET
jgi:hypothetical protein